MGPQLQYLQMMAQRFAGTPVGQWFASQAQKALDSARMLESRLPAIGRGPAGQFLARTPQERVPLAPIGRGLAGAGAAGSVAMGGPGSFNSLPELRERATAEVRPPISMGEEARPMDYGQMGGPDVLRSALSRPEPDYGQMGGPDILQRALSMTARPAKEAAVPLPPRRPAEVAAPPPMPSRAPVEAERAPAGESLWDIYNRTGNAADFVRADRAMREGRAAGGEIDGMRGMQPMPMPAPEQPKQGGAGGRDAAINKALEIIHHLIVRG
jgi:hypothetical protein